METPDDTNTIDLTPFLHSEIFRIFESRYSFDSSACRESVTNFLSSPRLKNSVNHPITSTLFQRSKEHAGGHIFEVSSQLGCRIGCPFCNCGDFKGDLIPEEIIEQIELLQQAASAAGILLNCPNKISFTDGGELLMNPRCIDIIRAVAERFYLKLKISTVMPDTEMAREHLKWLLGFTENYPPGVCFQISLSSTNPDLRQGSSNRRLMSFQEIRQFGEDYTLRHPKHRKATITFTLTEESRCVPEEIVSVLPPSLFRIRVHPYKPNRTCFNTMPDDICLGLKKKFDDEFGYEKTILDVRSQFEKTQLLRGGTRALG